MIDIFDADYFERGIESGKSCFRNYRWIPEMTIPMVMTIIDKLGIKRGQKVLDFGCAKGYVVKAFRLLHRDAYGVDVSKYAIDNCDKDIQPYLFLNPEKGITVKVGTEFDFCIAKDVFEHIPQRDLVDTLLLLSVITEVLFVCVPLGKNGIYNAPTNQFDVTHIICEDEVWWSDIFVNNGWELEEFTFRVDGIKDSYYSKYPTAHGFFTLRSKNYEA